jgi:hypothetical protein
LYFLLAQILENGDKKKFTNYILAKYNIFVNVRETRLFYNSYIDSIDSIKIDGKEEKIICTKFLK